MIWIVIGLVLVVAFGPVFYLMPSPREREVSKLRSIARQSGLVIEMIDLPKVDAAPTERVSSGGKPRDAKTSRAAYRHRLPRARVPPPVWRLLKSPRENRYLEGWTTLTPPKHVPPNMPDYWARVGAIINALPGGCLAVDAAEEMVAWIGRETLQGASPDDVIAGIRSGLEALANLHASLSETESAMEEA